MTALAHAEIIRHLSVAQAEIVMIRNLVAPVIPSPANDRFQIVITAVADKFGLPPEILVGTAPRDAGLIWPRFVARVLALNLVPLNTVQAGRAFNCHHTTISNARDVIRDWTGIDKTKRKEFAAVKRRAQKRLKNL